MLENVAVQAEAECAAILEAIIQMAVARSLTQCVIIPSPNRSCEDEPRRRGGTRRWGDAANATRHRYVVASGAVGGRTAGPHCLPCAHGAH